MAIAFSDISPVCQEAFYLIRQDAAVLTADNWSAGRPIEVAKCKLSVDGVVNEVVDAFGWRANVTAANVPQWPSKVRNALVYALARKLSLQVAGRLEDMRTYDALYRDALQNAKVADLNEGVAALTDPLLTEVFAQSVTKFTPEAKNLPWGFAELVKRLEVLKDTARVEVLMAHDWNFAKVVEDVGCAEIDRADEYSYCCDYPRRALRLVAVYDERGKMTEWKVEDGMIVARGRIARIRYVRDVAVDKWSVAMRSVLVRKLCALVARTVLDNTQDASMQEQLYQLAVENAKLRDTRESATPTDAWGDNYYVKAMHGGR